MSRDEEQCLKLGQMVVRMIRDLQATPADDVGFARRAVTFPGGEVHLFVVRGSELAEKFEKAADRDYSVETVIPKSAIN